MPKFFKISDEVAAAQRRNQPIVALETAVLTHGLPRPQNLQTAQRLEEAVREEGAVPATIGVLDGRVLVGFGAEELKKLADVDRAVKLSSRNLADAITQGKSGGTTVAGTLRVAGRANLSVFATGGIGGVHSGGHWDVSADLPELARQPVIVVCAGAKSILDLPATLEQLETLGVPVIGYQTDKFPAFFSRESGLKLDVSVKNAEEAAEIAQRHWQLGGGGLLLAAPPPEEAALPRDEVESWIQTATAEADTQGIHGQKLTPYLLRRIHEISKGKTLNANMALLENNAGIAAKIATHLQPPRNEGFGLLGNSA
ncbi:MAG: pseudouridine-5'-phosphate glycosidase [Chloroflexi bacterium]|nr:pseudouridine-5'-phosphate glycosidase [Chloroflexota bacterium]